MQKDKICIVWFKRDLRVHDHLPLYQASLSGLPVLPLYVVEADYWQQPFASVRHWGFIYDCLCELRESTRRLGQPLVVRVGDVFEVLQTLLSHYNIKTIYVHEETSNLWAYQRDTQVTAWCRSHHIALYASPTNGIVRRLRNRDDWANIRNHRMSQPLTPKPEYLIPLKSLELGEIPSKADPLFEHNDLELTNDQLLSLESQQAGGRLAAMTVLRTFLGQRAQRYLFHLSQPGLSEQFCSRLSPHLTWGTVSVREVEHATRGRREKLNPQQRIHFDRNLNAFSARLAWRCHFIQKIEDQPTIETQCMHKACEMLRERGVREPFFSAWTQGKTGYPLIDACMRHLVREGWITFRMRAMLVSFASYHLWLDWRETGAFLARVFIDYEPGIHYSQLQMQSGVTGINAIRIYNPTKQSQVQDPKGIYIKRWLPELRHVPSVWIHEPWKMSATQQRKYGCIIGEDYPAPLVDHVCAVRHAKEKLAQVRSSPEFKQMADQVYKKLGSRKKRSKLRRSKQTKPSEQLTLF